MPGPAAVSIPRDRRLALALLCAATLMTIVDETVVSVALPTIQRDLGFATSELSWVVNAYLIAFGGLLLLAGRIGDLVGRRSVLLAGLSLFVAASVLCGVAPSAPVARRGAVRPGRRRRARRRRRAGDGRRALRRSAPAGPRHRGLLVRRGLGRFDRPLPRRPHHRRRRLALGVLHQRAVRHRHRARRTARARARDGPRPARGGRRGRRRAPGDRPDAGHRGDRRRCRARAGRAGRGAARRPSRCARRRPRGRSSRWRCCARAWSWAPTPRTRCWSAPCSAFSSSSPCTSSACWATARRRRASASCRWPWGSAPCRCWSSRGSMRASARGRRCCPGCWPSPPASRCCPACPSTATTSADVAPSIALFAVGGGLTLPAIMTIAMSGATPETAGLASGLINTSQQVGGALGLAILRLAGRRPRRRPGGRRRGARRRARRRLSARVERRGRASSSPRWRWPSSCCARRARRLAAARARPLTRARALLLRRPAAAGRRRAQRGHRELAVEVELGRDALRRRAPARRRRRSRPRRCARRGRCARCGARSRRGRRAGRS